MSAILFDDLSKWIAVIHNLSLSGGYFYARRTKWAKKLVVEGPKTKLGESQFLKRINCHSIKMK